MPAIPTNAPYGKYRHTQSATTSSTTALSSHSPRHYHVNMQAHANNSQSDANRPHPSTPPRTPRRSEHGANGAKNFGPQVAQDGSHKPRSRPKQRPKNVVTSPQPTHSDRVSPPLTGTPAASIPQSKPIATPAAFAGPTFHASPAPSALPIPKGFSKSAPKPAAPAGFTSAAEETSSDENSSPTPPASQVATNQFQREESPLDFFFKADREEKAARARGSSSASGPFRPPLDSPQNTRTPSNHQDRSRSAHFSGGSGSGMFAMELDGNHSPGKPYGPAFSTPYNQRINAARSSAASSPTIAGLDGSKDIRSQSQALNDFLFKGQSPRSPATPRDNSPMASPYGSLPSPQTCPPSISSTPQHGGFRNTSLQSRAPHGSFSGRNDSTTSISRSSGLRQEVTPTVTPERTVDRRAVGYQQSPTPSHTYGNNGSATPGYNGSFPSQQATATADGVSGGSRGPDLLDMEESLRRILKLDSSNNASMAGGIGRMPSAAASVPNYVGGRPPPMNGMHNGVMGS
jgi:hypothetical protein